jgi:PPOX class probable FMN-dependent enzyme
MHDRTVTKREDRMTNLTRSDLGTLYPKPGPRVLAKSRPTIERHAHKFISMPPFCVLATSGPDDGVDASPRGGTPGFVHVEGPSELLMPDRTGNNRLDNFRNILQGSGSVHLLFMVPGFDEMLRVGGKGTLTAELALMERMVEFGKPPRAILRIAVNEVYFHCGKAAMRSRLWSGEARMERKSFPSIGEINHELIRDHITTSVRFNSVVTTGVPGFIPGSR